ncbi:hypothetical protein MAMMFC1_02703 [Methylomusa anaerophila]|uniref:Uncharacterized protein n=1 Tax=Methylomusa anaerophila TaxID=1930071 RepID=A0A348ALS0_9FIRM|nr:hypothetical protein MAMMFC1_02703 [Methylomusa anaerophila]
MAFKKVLLVYDRSGGSGKAAGVIAVKPVKVKRLEIWVVK